MKISEVLHIAADERLCDCSNRPGGLEVFSCNAAWWAAYENAPKNPLEFADKVQSFLQSLGCLVHDPDAFSEFRYGYERQSVRYAWLKFAALIAEEEGI